MRRAHYDPDAHGIVVRIGQKPEWPFNLTVRRLNTLVNGPLFSVDWVSHHPVQIRKLLGMSACFFLII